MSDYEYLSVSNGSGDVALMHVTGTGRVAGGTTIPVDVVTNAPTKFIGTYGTLLPSGFLDPATMRNFKGHTSGANLIIDSFETGTGTDVGNTSGQVVIIKPTTGWANRVASFLQNMTGKGTPEDVTVGALTANALTVSAGPVALPAHALNSTTIDFTTVMADMNNMPVKSVSVAMGYGTSATIYRVGNMVNIQMNCTLSSLPQADGGHLAETIPTGYKPLASNTAYFVGSASFGNDVRVCWMINPDGTMNYGTATGISGATRLQGSGFWFTKDAWPA